VGVREIAIQRHVVEHTQGTHISLLVSGPLGTVAARVTLRGVMAATKEPSAAAAAGPETSARPPPRGD
jgi:hypothetical protein